MKPGGTAVGNTKGNPSIIYTDNSKVGSGVADETKGDGDNSFAIRAVTPVGKEKLVAVSGYNHMPIYANADSTSMNFNLIRVLPGAAGQFVSFSFYDIADVSGASGGTVKVTPPSDATWPGVSNGPFPGGCTAIGGNAGPTSQTLTNCQATVTPSKNNAQVETMSIPIPSTYTCNYPRAERVLVPGHRVLPWSEGQRHHHLGRDRRRRPGPTGQVEFGRQLASTASLARPRSTGHCRSLGTGGALGSAAVMSGNPHNGGLGAYGERVAAQWLVDQGMTLVDRNWRCEHGEIDLVLRDGDVLVFGEVKTRTSAAYGHPLEAVSAAKAERLRQLAVRWVEEHGVNAGGIRIDLVGVLLAERGAAEVEHLRGVG